MLEYPPNIDYGEPQIAFFGPMGSGKTFAAQNLFSDFVKFSLAGPLKQTAADYYNVTGKSNDERQILQELADDLKKWDNDVFTKRLLWSIHYFRQAGGKGPAIIDDLRFIHEANDLRRYGFLLIRVYVDEEVRLARIAEKYPDTNPARFQHASEKQWKDIKPDFTIHGEGNGPLDGLRESIYNRA